MLRLQPSVSVINGWQPKDTVGQSSTLLNITENKGFPDAALIVVNSRKLGTGE